VSYANVCFSRVFANYSIHLPASLSLSSSFDQKWNQGRKDVFLSMTWRLLESFCFPIKTINQTILTTRSQKNFWSVLCIHMLIIHLLTNTQTKLHYEPVTYTTLKIKKCNFIKLIFNQYCYYVCNKKNKIVLYCKCITKIIVE